MNLLSLYGVVAVALLVCCLTPGDVTGKPVKNSGRHSPNSGRGSGHQGRGQGRDHQGKGRPHQEESSAVNEPTSSSGYEEDGPSSVSPTPSGEVEDDQPRGSCHLGRSIRPRRNPNCKPKKMGPIGLEEAKEAKKNRNMKKAMGYMSKYGYMGGMTEDDWNTGKVSEKKMKKGVQMMQKFMGLSETGELDAMTLMMMDKPRCGLPDMPSPIVTEGNSSSDGPESYQHFNRKWDQSEITFRFLNYPSNMPESDSREAIIRAFRVWSDVTPLTFREVGRSVPEYADFYIKFGARSHGDNFPFDGRGGVLAHAFLPKTNSGDLEGDIHFDDEEPFTYASYDGINLFQVAVHEIGHSLGLSHSNVPTALMAPFYPGYQPTFYLPYDDLSGIQSLYGSRPNPLPQPYPYPNPDLSQPTNPPSTTTTVAPAEPTTAPVTSSSDPTATVPSPSPTPGGSCPRPQPEFDAITVWRGEFFAFTGDKYGRIRGYDILSQDGGSQAGYFFQNFPGDIDAIYETPLTYKLLVFKGSYFYVYEGLMQESGPIPITNLDPSLPSNLDAVVPWKAYRKTFFFKDDLVWRFDEVSQRVDSGWPNRIDEVWAGLPVKKVTAAWHDEEQYLTYFLSGKDYFRYDDLYAEVDVGYPRNFLGDSFGCF